MLCAVRSALSAKFHTGQPSWPLFGDWHEEMVQSNAELRVNIGAHRGNWTDFLWAVRKTNVIHIHFPEGTRGTLEFNESRSLLGHLRVIQSHLGLKRCHCHGEQCCLPLVASLKYNLHCSRREIWSVCTHHTEHGWCIYTPGNKVLPYLQDATKLLGE